MILTAWLLHSIRLAAALGTALLLMQAPAVTREYQAALLQLVRSSDQEIAERKASAQRFYGIGSGEDDKRFLSELQAVEPSNAQTLVALVERELGLRQSYDRIEHASDLIRPIVAAEDVTADKTGSRRQIAYTVFDSFALQLDLSFAAAGLWPGRAVPGLADRRVTDRCSATASRPSAKMNRFLTASRRRCHANGSRMGCSQG